MKSYNGLALTTSGINIVAIMNAKAMLIPFVLNLENPYAAMAQITVPVSYTHLDVYKRQSINCVSVGNSPNKRRYAPSSKTNLFPLLPVTKSFIL